MKLFTEYLDDMNKDKIKQSPEWYRAYAPTINFGQKLIYADQFINRIQTYLSYNEIDDAYLYLDNKDIASGCDLYIAPEPVLDSVSIKASAAIDKLEKILKERNLSISATYLCPIYLENSTKLGGSYAITQQYAKDGRIFRLPEYEFLIERSLPAKEEKMKWTTAKKSIKQSIQDFLDEMGTREYEKDAEITSLKNELAEKKKYYEAEHNGLKEAYEEEKYFLKESFEAKLEAAEKEAEKGYKEAWDIIADLKEKLENHDFALAIENHAEKENAKEKQAADVLATATNYVNDLSDEFIDDLIDGKSKVEILAINAIISQLLGKRMMERADNKNG